MGFLDSLGYGLGSLGLGSLTWRGQPIRWEQMDLQARQALRQDYSGTPRASRCAYCGNGWQEGQQSCPSCGGREKK